MAKKPLPDLPVSANNPCPFLRGLVCAGELADDVEPLGQVATTIVRCAHTGDGEPELPRLAIMGVALIANGLGPLSIYRTAKHGVRLDALRGGPLDKKGVGSGILDQHGIVDPGNLARLATFGSPKTRADGTQELGFDLAELTEFMNANFARAIGHRRRIDRKLMNGEWPELLKVMGIDGLGGRYLSFHDVEVLFTERRFPQRMSDQFEAEQ